MKRIFSLSLLLTTYISYSQQQPKAELIKELSGILNKAAGISWTSSELTTTIKSQTASERQITTVIHRKGYAEGTGSIDKSYTNVYTLTWDSLKKTSTNPPTGKKFSLSGCSETNNYCVFQLSFKPYSLKSVEYDVSSDYSSYNTWFEVYVKKEDQEKFFACLQKLYKLLHPNE